MQSSKEYKREKRKPPLVFLDQCKEIEENNRMERLEISSRKFKIPREYFMQRWALNGVDLTKAEDIKKRW